MKHILAIGWALLFPLLVSGGIAVFLGFCWMVGYLVMDSDVAFIDPAITILLGLLSLVAAGIITWLGIEAFLFLKELYDDALEWLDNRGW